MSKSKLTEAFKQTVEPKEQQVEKPVSQAKAGTQASRVKKKSINAFVDPAVVKQLKMLSAETEKTQQDLLKEAINELFIKYGKKGIA